MAKSNPWQRRLWVVGAVVVLVVSSVVALMVSCGSPEPTPIPTPFPTARVIFIPTPVTPTPQLEPATPRPGTTKVNLDAIAPPGRGRDLVIMNCGNCHPFVCALRGQRTVEHWELVKQFHAFEHWGVVEADQDYDLLFSYLEANFNDKKPEPELPPALADLGCTTSALR